MIAATARRLRFWILRETPIPTRWRWQSHQGGEIRGWLTGGTVPAQYAVMLLQSDQNTDVFQVAFVNSEARFRFCWPVPGTLPHRREVGYRKRSLGARSSAYG